MFSKIYTDMQITYEKKRKLTGKRIVETVGVWKHLVQRGGTEL